MELTLHLVRQLRGAVEARTRRTSIRHSHAATKHTDGEVWLKLECQQVTGSFKVRGPLALRAFEGSPRPWVAASAGNHGLGVAYTLRGIAAAPRIFVPRTSAQVKRAAMSALGAEIQVVDTPSYDAAETVAKSWAQEHGALFVSPFDDPCIMAGNGGTLGLEILEQLPHVGSILVPVGGGGLISGLACVVRALRPGTRLVGVQSEHTPAMFESRRRGRALLTHHGPPTLAEGLEGGVSERSFAYVSRWVDDLRLVAESSIAAAMRWLWQEEGLRVEGSAAVGMAALLEGLSFPSPVCVVLSGSNVDPETWEGLFARTS